MVAGIPDERPAVAIRFAEKIWNVSCTEEAFNTSRIASAFSESRSNVQGLDVVLLNIGTIFPELAMRPDYPDASKSVVCHRSKNHAVVAPVDLESINGEAAPIGV